MICNLYSFIIQFYIHDSQHFENNSLFCYTIFLTAKNSFFLVVNVNKVICTCRSFEDYVDDTTKPTTNVCAGAYLFIEPTSLTAFLRTL